MADRPRLTPPVADTRTPKLKLPDGACDTHFHIYGPQAKFPLPPQRPYDTDDLPVEALLALHAKLGISRGVIVQSMLHGNTFEYLIDACARFPDRLRGVAMPASDVSDADLARMEKAGIVAHRVAYRWSPKVDERFLARLTGRGWHIQYWVRSEEEMLDWLPVMKRTKGPIVIDHMGWQDAGNGPDTRGFRAVLDLLGSGKAYVKLSGPYRFSRAPGAPWADVLPFVRKLVATAPERLLWGTDWPHPDHHGVMPNDADFVDILAEWLPSEALRQQVLVDNPAKLFRF